MGESFEILFWLAVFVFIALRGAAQNRSKSKTSRPDPQDDGAREPEGGRRGIFADLMRQIEAQVEGQRGAAERGTGAPAEAELGSVEPGREIASGAPGAGRPSPAEARRLRVEGVEARAHPADRRAPTPHGPERGYGAGPSAPRPPIAPEPWRRPRVEPEDRDPERRHVASGPAPDETYLVPGRRVHAPGTVSVGRSPETASALSRGPATTPIGAGSGEDVRVEGVTKRRTGAAGLDRFDRYSSLRRAILLSEVLAPPPGLTGRPQVDRRFEEIG